MSSKKEQSKKVAPKFEVSIKHRRRFSKSFKEEKIQEILEKRISIAEFCKLYHVSRTSVYNWLYEYSSLEPGVHQVIEMESEAVKTKRLQEQVANLERKIGQKQLEIDYLQTTLEIAGEELGYDLKKKYAPAL